MHSPGVWRYDWISDPDGEPGTRKRVRQGLILSEALIRACLTAEPGEQASLIELFESIERGAIDGGVDGPHPNEEESADG